jgi:YHS domain-containing protein
VKNRSQLLVGLTAALLLTLGAVTGASASGLDDSAGADRLAQAETATPSEDGQESENAPEAVDTAQGEAEAGHHGCNCGGNCGHHEAEAAPAQQAPCGHHAAGEHEGCGHDGTTADTTQGELATCPVCGTAHSITAESPSLEYEATTYHFCCEQCAQMFAANPSDYI